MTAKAHHKEALLGLIAEHARRGELPTSGRFLYYELKQLDLIRSEARRPDNAINEALTELRDDGLVDWEAITDETRSVTAWSTHPSVLDGVLAGLDGIALDPWDADAPVIITESRSLAGVLRATVAARYRVPITALNGQAGAGHLHNEVAPLLRVDEPDVLYLGDHNRAGGDIEANVERRLVAMLGRDVGWKRVAITAEQAGSLPPKMAVDRRLKHQAPEPSFECEALGQGEVVRLVVAALDELRELRGLPPLGEFVKREHDERRAIRERLR